MANIVFKLAILAIILSVYSQKAAAQNQTRILKPLVESLKFQVSNLECSRTVTETRQCHTDCKTLLFCDGTNTKPMDSIECSPASPFCFNGKCQAERPASCPAKRKTCPGKNKYYPDLNSCFVTYPCDGNRKSGVDEVCPSYMPFDFNLQDCTLNAPCSLINCAGKKYASHPIYPTLNVLCKDGKPVEISYTECSESYQFGPSFDCEFKCTKPGNFANVNDYTKKKYYSCSLNQLDLLVVNEKSCPGETVFDLKQRKCVEPPAPPARPPRPPITWIPS